MSDFLSTFAKRHRQEIDASLSEVADRFEPMIKIFNSALGNHAFRLRRAFNAAVFDAMAVGLAARLERDEQGPTVASVRQTHDALLQDEAFLKFVSRSTADEAFVQGRIQLASEQFARIY